jgi:hypothetical protein
VIIIVLRPETGWKKHWATINYGWENLDFYRKWGKGSTDPIELKGPFLDPLNAQSEFSTALLDLFRLLLNSSDYVRRLRNHYEMFRVAVEEELHRKSSQTQRVAKWTRR